MEGEKEKETMKFRKWKQLSNKEKGAVVIMLLFLTYCLGLYFGYDIGTGLMLKKYTPLLENCTRGVVFG